ncbi:MAG: choice-of-anchor D domain-containing protein [Terriglobales bacterium]|jgi:ASPM-SPD-2-Hydin domain-containing protein/centrosomal CEP192-like protein
MRYFPRFFIAALLCGLGIAPASAQQLQCNPCRHAFNEVQVGDNRTFSIQLSNTGRKLLTISSISVQGSEFSFSDFSLPAKIQPGASVQLPVVFAPTVQGWARGVLSLVSNDPNSPLYIYLWGHGFGEASTQLGINPSSLNFGNVNVGSSATLQATLTASNGSVTISSDGSTSSEFAVTGLSLPVTLESGQSLPITIQFTPNASGAASGQVGFTSNAENSPTVEQVAGTGVAQSSHNVYLSWEPGKGNPVGYNIYRGTSQNGPYQMINTSLDSSTNYTDYTVSAGDTYYYVATEVNAQGEESGYSNVAEAVIP